MNTTTQLPEGYALAETVSAQLVVYEPDNGDLVRAIIESDGTVKGGRGLSCAVIGAALLHHAARVEQGT